MNATTDYRWKELYKIAAVAAIVSELVILLGIALYFVYPYAPGTKSTQEIFAMLQSNPLGGLISLDLFLFIGNIFSIPLFLGLYVSLRQANESYALVALALGLIGVVSLIPSRPLFGLFALSGQYAAAASDTARSQLIAAGDALLAQFDGTGWFMNTLLGAFSLLISSLLMLRGNFFTKSTAYVGIVTNAAVCFFFIPMVGKLLLFISLLGYMIWYFQLARKFFQMGRKA